MKKFNCVFGTLQSLILGRGSALVNVIMKGGYVGANKGGAGSKSPDFMFTLFIFTRFLKWLGKCNLGQPSSLHISYFGCIRVQDFGYFTVKARFSGKIGHHPFVR